MHICITEPQWVNTVCCCYEVTKMEQKLGNYFNINIIFPCIGFPISKVRWSWNDLIFITKIPLLVKMGSLVWSSPWSLNSLKTPQTLPVCEYLGKIDHLILSCHQFAYLYSTIISVPDVLSKILPWGRQNIAYGKDSDTEGILYHKVTYVTQTQEKKKKVVFAKFTWVG